MVFMGDIMVRNGAGLRVFHGIFCVKFTVLRCFFNILTLFSLKTVLSKDRSFPFSDGDIVMKIRRCGIIVNIQSIVNIL